MRALLLLLALVPMLFASKGLTASDIAWMMALKTFVTDVVAGMGLYLFSSVVASVTGISLPSNPFFYVGIVFAIALVHMLIELILFAIAAILYGILFGG